MPRHVVMTGGAVAPDGAEGRRRVELTTVERRDATVVLASRRRRVETVADVATGEHRIGHHQGPML